MKLSDLVPKVISDLGIHMTLPDKEEELAKLKEKVEKRIYDLGERQQIEVLNPDAANNLEEVWLHYN